MAEGARRFFLVERYVPSTAEASIVAAAERLERPPARAVAASREEPTRPVTGSVRHLYTVVVTAEDTCLSLFEADSREAVAAANERAGFPLDRIVEVSLVGRTAGRDQARSGLAHRRR